MSIFSSLFGLVRTLFLVKAFLVFAVNAHAQNSATPAFLDVVRSVAYAYPQTQAAAQGLEAAKQDQSAAAWQRAASPSFQRISPQGSGTAGQINRLALEQPISLVVGLQLALTQLNNAISQGITSISMLHKKQPSS